MSGIGEGDMYIHNKIDLEVPEYKDRYGRLLHKGDLCLECRGEAYSGGFSYILYEVAGLDPFTGSGIMYNKRGNPSTFSYVHMSDSCKLDPQLLGDDILFTFYHGGREFDSPLEFGEQDNSLDIIKQSDYWVLSHDKLVGLDITKDIVPCPRCGGIPTFTYWHDEKNCIDHCRALCGCGVMDEVTWLFAEKDKPNQKSAKFTSLISWNTLAGGVKLPEGWQDTKPTLSDTKPTLDEHQANQ